MNTLKYRIGDNEYQGFSLGDRVRIDHLVDPRSAEGAAFFHGIENAVMLARQPGASGYIGEIFPDAINDRPEPVFFIMHDDEFASGGDDFQTQRFIGAYLAQELKHLDSGDSKK